MRVRKYRSRKHQEEAKKRLKRRLIIFSSLFVIFVGLIAWGSYQDSVAITDIEIVGASYIGPEKVETVVRENLVGKTLIFSRKSILFAPISEILNDVKGISPRIKSAKIQRVGLNSMRITVEERDVFALWCQGSSFERECYFVDDEAHIFSKAPNLTTDIYVVYSGGIEKNPLDQKFTDLETFDKANAFVDFLEEKRIDVEELRFLRENNVEAYTESGAKIIFLAGDIEHAAQNLASALDATNVEGFELDKIDYIDLRYGNKVFWKPKVAETQEE